MNSIIRGNGCTARPHRAIALATAAPTTSPIRESGFVRPTGGSYR
jgi:hypothetical protein